MAKKKDKPTDRELDGTRDEAEVKTVAQASRDDVPEEITDGYTKEEMAEPTEPEAAELDTSASDEADDGAETVIEETVELEEPEQRALDYDDMDDPRLTIAKNFDKKHRADLREVGEVDAADGQSEEEDLENEDLGDIIDPITGEELVEIVVFGETQYAKKANVDKAGGIQAYQKQEAVRLGMEQNAQQRNTLDTRAASLDERERRVAEKEAAIPTLDSHTGQTTIPTDPPTGDQTIDALAAQYQEAVYDGDESAPTLLAQLVKAAAGTPVDVEQVKREAADEFEKRERHKKVVKATRAMFASQPQLDRKKPEFDQRLYTAVNDETDVVARQHDDWEPDQVIAEAWRRVSSWKGGHKTESMTTKQANKRNTIRPKVGSDRYTKPAPPPKKTASDYVESLKQNRGQI